MTAAESPEAVTVTVPSTVTCVGTPSAAPSGPDREHLEAQARQVAAGGKLVDQLPAALEAARKSIQQLLGG